VKAAGAGNQRAFGHPTHAGSLARPLLTSGAMSSHTHAVHQFPTVRQYMTPGPHTISPAQPLTIARRQMLDHEVRHLPVLEGGRIVGLISERDLVAQGAEGVDGGEHSSKPAIEG
jgi:CBS domain-containing protein